MFRRTTSLLVALGLSLLSARTAQASTLPIDVSFVVTGSSGNYTIDFSVTNNMLAWPTQGIYLFGTALSPQDVSGSPTGWTPSFQSGFNPSAYGGSNFVLYNNWTQLSFLPSLMVMPGTTLSGFQVHSTSLTAPTSLYWAAFSISGTDPYTGGGNFWNNSNPGFEGFASNAAVPEPTALLLFGSGLALIAFRSRTRSKA